jgi:hypothetical protein
MMDNLHATLAAIRTETKSTPDHLTVFREFSRNSTSCSATCR